MSDDIEVGDRVRVKEGLNEGLEGHVLSVSEQRLGRRVVIITTDTGRRFVALPQILEKIPRLVH